MAQLVPALTSLPIDSTAAPSAEDIQARQPSICVDYLSHDWQEEDVWASWRSMTRHKNEIANGVRLENASWRTWQKQRNKLRTISPETLNWLKDSDVTWLYGPLHTAAVEPVRPLKISSTDDRLGIVRADSTSGKKPILKHRTLSEMLTIPMPSSPILESSSHIDDANVPDLDGESNRPTLMQTKSDTNIVRRNVSSGRHGSPDRSVISSGGRSPANEPSLAMPSPGIQSAQAQPVSTPASDAGSGKRHISFNTFVEQCISVDEPPEQQSSDSDSDDSDSVLEMRSNRSSGSSSRSSRPSFSRNSSTSSAEHLTIAKIAPTTLKTTGVFPAPSPAVVFAPPPEYQSPSASSASSSSSARNNAINSSYDFPSPKQSNGKWDNDDEDDYSSVGFDYFSGPDLGVGSEYDKQKGATAVQSHTGSAGYASGPKGAPGANLQAQVQAAKGGSAYRASPQSSNSSSNNTSQNSSASATPTQTPAISTSPRSSISGQGNATQPGRSILKVRPPGQASKAPEPEDPSSYFNFNPSAATGFGMNQPRNGPVASSLPTQGVVGPTGSPVTSPALSTSLGNDGPSERGRSSVRQGSSASIERSGSRSTTGSVASVSPNAAPRPVSMPHPHPPQSDPSAGTSGPTTTTASPSPAAPAPPAGAAPATGSGLAASGSVKGQKPPAIKTPSGLGGDHSSADSGGQSPGRSPWSDAPNGDAMDVDIPERSETPTPHSSPQIAFRPMVDTSAASLPHASTSTSSIPQANPSPSSASDRPAFTQSSSDSKQPTVAQASTTAHPVISPPHSRSASQTLVPTQGDAEGREEGEDETIVGRAVNMANQAKGIIGHLWGYAEANPGSTTPGHQRTKSG